jgi:uncharacterized membrane protein (DUF485 family)
MARLSEPRSDLIRHSQDGQTTKKRRTRRKMSNRSHSIFFVFFVVYINYSNFQTTWLVLAIWTE